MTPGPLPARSASAGASARHRARVAVDLDLAAGLVTIDNEVAAAQGHPIVGIAHQAVPGVEYRDDDPFLVVNEYGLVPLTGCPDRHDPLAPSYPSSAARTRNYIHSGRRRPRFPAGLQRLQLLQSK